MDGFQCVQMPQQLCCVCMCVCACRVRNRMFFLRPRNSSKCRRGLSPRCMRDRCVYKPGWRINIASLVFLDARAHVDSTTQPLHTLHAVRHSKQFTSLILLHVCVCLCVRAEKNQHHAHTAIASDAANARRYNMCNVRAPWLACYVSTHSQTLGGFMRTYSMCAR